MNKFGARSMEIQNKEVEYYTQYDGKEVSEEVIRELMDLESFEKITYVPIQMSKGVANYYRIDLTTVWLTVHTEEKIIDSRIQEIEQ